MFLTKATNLVLDSLLALLYPQSCAVCQGEVDSRHLGTVCAECWRAAKLFSAAEILCWKCGAPSLGKVAPESREAVMCRSCDNDSFTVARACGAYDGALKAVVLALKREPNVCRQLVELLIDTQQRHPLNQATLIIPVPLHPDREKARGFNQATVVGKRLAKGTGLRYEDRSLFRTTHSERHRAGMDATARRASVANSFAVRAPRVVAGEKIVLVDDVFTTGATASACAEALLEAGAAAVFVLTIARPVRYHS
ncbi:MAG TPA: double zinc ribbon domain-containing protein [Pyrinomonadaceae bacterium]|nr:double zinc ribbon domain-containing protein [Pyrinomonadaceae bacterium]